MPGWNASIGGVSITQVVQNNYTGGAASVDIFGPNWTLLGPGIIGGNYTVYLQAFSSSQGNVSLWQNGTIPANAASLEFSAWSQYNPAYFLVSFAGNNLSPVMLSSGTAPSGQPYDVFGVNIAPYAGQTGQLQFTALDNNPPGNIGMGCLIAYMGRTSRHGPVKLVNWCLHRVMERVLRRLCSTTLHFPLNQFLSPVPSF